MVSAYSSQISRLIRTNQSLEDKRFRLQKQLNTNLQDQQILYRQMTDQEEQLKQSTELVKKLQKAADQFIQKQNSVARLAGSLKSSNLQPNNKLISTVMEAVESKRSKEAQTKFKESIKRAEKESGSIRNSIDQSSQKCRKLKSDETRIHSEIIQVQRQIENNEREISRLRMMEQAGV